MKYNFIKKELVFYLITVFILLSTQAEANIFFVKENIDVNILSDSISFNQKTIANWTMIYYLCCENHISYETDIIVRNLTKIGSSDDFNIVVLKDGDQNGDSGLYFIEEGNASKLNDIYGLDDELNLSDPYILESFLDIIKNDFPAKHYAFFILSDRGSGWQGILHDTRNPNKEIPLMSMPMFAGSLKNFTNNGVDKIDVIVFMPCVTGMFEVAYELSPYVDYMVASEEHMLEELDKGEKYILQYFESTYNLKNNTAMTPEDFASSVVDYYHPCDFPFWVLYYYMIGVKKGEYSIFIQILSDFLTKIFNNLRNPNHQLISLHTTLSAVNLSKIDGVAQKLDNLSSILILNKNDEDIKQAIAEARFNVREYAKFYPKMRKIVLFHINLPVELTAFDSFVDLYDMVELIKDSVENQSIKDACSEVLKGFEELVLVNSAMPSDPSHGLSIYFPRKARFYNRYLWDDKITYLYEELLFSKGTLWDDFLKVYLKITT